MKALTLIFVAFLLVGCGASGGKFTLADDIDIATRLLDIDSFAAARNLVPASRDKETITSSTYINVLDTTEILVFPNVKRYGVLGITSIAFNLNGLYITWVTDPDKNVQAAIEKELKELGWEMMGSVFESEEIAYEKGLNRISLRMERDLLETQVIRYGKYNR